MCSSLSEVCEDEAGNRKKRNSKVLKNTKTSGSDDLVGELLKYGGSGMVYLLFGVVW